MNNPNAPAYPGYFFGLRYQANRMTQQSMRYQFIHSALIAAVLLIPVAASVAAEQKPPSASETAQPAKQPAGRAGKPAESKAHAAVKVKIVDINSADLAELKALPGVGAAEAEKIVSGRPFGSKSQLTTRGILSRDVYENIKQRVIAKQDKNTVAKLIQK